MSKSCTVCKSQPASSLAGVLLCDQHRQEIEAEVAELQSQGKQADATAIARRMYNRLHDTTRTERVNRRNEELNAKARKLGFESLSQMLTAWKNDEVELVVKHT